jgi:hypothetical protein
MKVTLDIKPMTILSALMLIGTGYLIYMVGGMIYREYTGERVQVCKTIVAVGNCDHTGIWCGATFDDGTKGLAKFPEVGKKVCHEEIK